LNDANGNPGVYYNNGQSGYSYPSTGNLGSNYYSTGQGSSGGGVSITDQGGDQDTLARVVYGEARGQSEAAQQGVASVVLNRVRAGSFGSTISAVCLAPNQFTCMSPSLGGSDYTATMAVEAGDPTFDACLSLAAQAIAGTLPDDTGGATYYYDTSIAQPSFWASHGIVKTVQIGALVFGAPQGLFS